MTCMVLRRVCSLAATQPMPRQITLVRQASTEGWSSPARGSPPIRSPSLPSHTALRASSHIRTAPLSASAVSTPAAKKAPPPPVQGHVAPVATDTAATTVPAGSSRKMTGWLVFCGERRPVLKAGKPELKATDLLKIMGQEWKALPEKYREQYNKKAAALPPIPVKAKAKPAAEKKKSNRKPTAPNGYMMYANEHRQRVMSANPGASATVIAKKLGEEWRKLSDPQKAEYKARGLKKFQETMAAKQ